MMGEAQTPAPVHTEQTSRPTVRRSSSRDIPRPVAEGLQCLRESAVPFALLHADTNGLDQLPCLELHIDPGEHKIAFAALRRAGYREMHGGLRFAAARVFLRHENGRFFALVIRAEFVHEGVRFMDARLASGRVDMRHALPLLGAEDRFLYVLVASLLTGRALTDGEKVALRKLRRDRLDAARLVDQTRPFGLDEEMRRIVQDLELYLWDPKQWKRLARRVRRALLRVPENKRGAWSHWKASRMRKSFKPVVLAVTGPSGSGCTTFARALEQQLERSPLRASRVDMGCWNATSLLAALVRRLAPTETAWGRLYRAACGRSTHLSDAERRYLATRRPSLAPLAARAAWHAARNVVFHVLVVTMLSLRYARRVSRNRAAIVVADGWIYDLGFRPGRAPYTNGARLRRWIYQRFPLPDGILYTATGYEQAASHNRTLEREPYEAAQRGMRRLLEPQEPLELLPDAAPEQMATTFLHRYWAHLLERHNRHT